MSEETTKMKIILISGSQSALATDLSRGLGEACRLSPEDFCAPPVADNPEASCVYLPASAHRDGMTPDLAEAQRVFQCAAKYKISQFILLASALIYGAGPGRQALVNEEYSPPANGKQRIRDEWASLESLASNQLQHATALTILRLPVIAGASTFPARLLSRRIVPTLPGHDPVFQLLSVSDLARA